MTRFAGDNCVPYVFQPTDKSYKDARPVEAIGNDVVVVPTVQRVVEKELGGVARGAMPARGLEVRNSFGNLIGWLDPGVKAEIRAVER